MVVTELFSEAKVSGPLAVPKVHYTIAKSDRPLAKRFSVRERKPFKESGDAPLASGIAMRSTLEGTASAMAAQLAAQLAILGSDQVLICAPPPEGQESWPLVVDDRVEDTPGAISRTRTYFKVAAGPALCPFDFDYKEFPDNIKDKLIGRSLRDPLGDVFPSFASAAHVSRPSMSTGIRHKASGATTPVNGGLHIYFIAKDGRDVPRFARVLRDRLILASWGWPQVTADGRILIKTLIDFNASTDVARLWYEGAAILQTEELEFVPDARKPVVRQGGFLDTSLLLDLTDAEREELSRIEFALRAEKTDEAERKRLEHKQMMRGRVTKLDPTKFAGFDEDHDLAVDKQLLQGNFPIRLDNGNIVTAAEIVAAPSRYVGQTCPDPLEPEYGAGRNLAIILNGGGDLRIESQAHGGITYEIRLKVADVWEPVEDEPSKKNPAERTITPTRFIWRDPSTVKPREWLYGGHYLRKFISATVAPGSLGKSSLIIVEAMAMAAGRPLLGVNPHGRFRTWYWNGEDPIDEIERRALAVMMYYHIDPADIEGHFFYDSGRATPLTIARMTKDGATIYEPDIDAVKAAVRVNGIDALMIDPFVSSHRVTENSNDEMAMVARAWAQLADELNISIELVHHARKLNGKEVTAEDSRGGGALVDAARAVRTLTRPTDKEMRSLGLSGDARSYFRFGQGKDNLTAPAGKSTKWLTLRSQHLGNATPEYPAGDSIGVVAEYTPTISTTVAEGDKTRAILDILSSGEYLDSAVSRDRWVGSVVAGVLGLEASDPDDRQEVLGVIKSLKGAGLIKAIHRTDPNTRKPRQYIEVCSAEEIVSNG